MPLSEPLFDSSYLTLYDPLSRPWHFVALELIFLLCAGLTLLHALRAARGRDAAPLFTWVCVFVYGLLMEIASYNGLDNFAHGQFTVMLYYQKLPLYISVLYPVFIYTAIWSVRRWQINRWLEPFAVGLLIVALDMPFDIMGPDLGWWTWSETDPNLSFRWLGVPVTSYYWHLTWGGLLALTTGALSPWAADLLPPPAGAGRLWKLLASFVLAPLTMSFGVLAFLPYHGLKLAGMSDGTVVAGLFVLAFAVVLLALRPARAGADRALGIVPMLYFLFFAVLAWVCYGGSSFAQRQTKLAVITGVILLATGALLALFTPTSPESGSANIPSPDP